MMRTWWRTAFLHVSLVLGLLFLSSVGSRAQSPSPQGHRLQQKQDRVVMGGGVRVEPGEEVHGSVVTMGNWGTPTWVAGHVFGDCVALAGDITVAAGGVVERDVVAIGGNIRLERGARAGRSVVSILGTVEREPGSDVGREIVTIVAFRHARLVIVLLLGLLLPMVSVSWGSDIFVALLLLLFARERVRRAADQLAAAPERCSLWGVLGICGFVPLSLLLVATVVGIFLWPILLALYYLACVTGSAAVAVVVGQAMYRRGWLGESSFFTQGLVGLIVVSVVLAVVHALPGVGWVLAPLLALLLRTLGVGAALLLWFARRRSGPELS